MTRSASALCTILAVALLGTAAAAHATGRVVRVRTPAALGGRGGLLGPALAGHRLLWAARSPTGYDLYSARLDGTHRTVRHVSAGNPHASALFLTDEPGTLAASAQRIALTVFSQEYEFISDYGHAAPQTVYGGVVSGQAGGPMTMVAGCTDAESCRGWCPTPAVDVSEEAVAYSGGCPESVFVRDLAQGSDGAVHQFDGDEGRLAGPRLLTLKLYRAPHDLAVYDWRTGAKQFGISGAGYADIQADGKVALLRSGGDGAGELAWASAEQPVPRAITRLTGYTYPPRIARDLVALRRHPPTGGMERYEVRALDGRLVSRAFERDPFASMDFDGRTMVWARARCLTVSLVVWDLGRPPPLGASKPCPIPSLPRRSLKARVHTIPLAVACPRKPALGCRAEVEITTRQYGSIGPRSLAGPTVFALGPGRHAVYRLAVDRGNICATTGSQIPAIAALQVLARNPDRTRYARLGVKVTNLEAARSDC